MEKLKTCTAVYGKTVAPAQAGFRLRSMSDFFTN
jgi:hypothetical protein